MCGRFTIFDPIDSIENQFQVSFNDLDYKERYNIAPNQDVYTVIRDGENKSNRIGKMKWNLLPSFMKEPKSKYKMINARASTIDEKPSFRRLLSSQRCVIPISGFYEWNQYSSSKEPYFIHLNNKSIMPCAGLYDIWERNGERIVSCTMVTTSPNKIMEKVHHRMPVILGGGSLETWLDRGVTEKELLKSLLQEYDPKLMNMYQVSKEVNKTSNDYPELIKPVA